MSLQRQKIAAIAVALTAIPLLEATSNHTWVAGYGNDANQCTVLSPCATFQAALTLTSAGGVVSVLSPGDFGAMTQGITHAVTIDGGAVGGSITFTGPEGIYVNAGTSDMVILRHLTINGLNTGSDGIYIQQAGYVYVEDCDLENFTDIGLAINSVAQIHVVVRNTTIAGGLIGVRTFQSLPVNNVYPQYDIVSLRNVIITGAGSQGVFTRNGYMDISSSVISENNIGMWCDTGAWLNFSNSVLTFNGTDAQSFAPSLGGGIFMGSNNTFFWNNGTPPTPYGNSVLAPQMVSTHTPPPPDTPRQRRP